MTLAGITEGELGVSFVYKPTPQAHGSGNGRCQWIGKWVELGMLQLLLVH